MRRQAASMVTFYDDRSVQITSDQFRVRGRAYPLRSLARVWHRRGRRSWRATAGRGALGMALLVPLGTAVLGLVVALQIHASATVTVALIGGACLLGLAVGPLADLLLDRLDRSYDRGSHVREIWAEIQGRQVLLLRTADAQRFGRIYRALQRAIEGPTVVGASGRRPRFSPTAGYSAGHGHRGRDRPGQ
jgi:Family of unknown function (DUF6232)